MKKFFQENKKSLLAMIIFMIICNIRLPYYISAPGGTIDISDRIVYQDKEKYQGSLNMLYVREYIATVPIYLLSFVINTWDKESIKESQVSNETMEEIDLRNKIMLENSINNAKYVAYKAASKEITPTSKKHQVIATLESTNLKIGDEILAINNKSINNLEDIKTIITSSNLNDELILKIIRNKKELEVTETIKEIEGAKALGVMLITNYIYETNPEIELKFKKSESGSSGGLMMALSIYSAISDQDILKNRHIAGTGTIDIEGKVGEIDGIKYKIMGAAKNNIDIVLVPRANYKEAVATKEKYNYDLEIVSIDTFNDAITYLTN